MKNLQEIARRVRRPEDQLRFPIELLNQGYEPNYLANYRPDELGNIDEPTLSVLKRTLKQHENLETHRAKIRALLEKESLWTESVADVVEHATSIVQIDTTIRHARARKNARSIAEKCPAAQVLGQAILTLQGDTPADFAAWVMQTASVEADKVDETVAETKQWLTHMLSEDLRLMSELQRYVLRRANVTVKVLPEPPKGSEAEKQLDAHEDSKGLPSAAISSSTTDAPVPVATASSPETSAEGVASETAELPSLASETADTSNPEKSSADEASPDATVAPLIAEFNQGKKPSKPIKTKSLSEKQLSPRQRRRRWLRSILESYGRLKKPAGNLTPYQILMLSRGLRSQIIQLHFEYDKKPLVQLCREAFCPGRHPLHSLLLEISESALQNFLLPRIHQDVMEILEEYANEELTESAVVHLQSSLLQRPIHGHRILMIDAIGPKQAAVAIVDADGSVVFTGEIPCNSNRSDAVAQNVVTLGQWIHEHRVTLVSLSNGPARRYLVQSVAELLKQSSEGSLYWTMVDRAGADGYCNSRICLVELPNISRRHRSAVWLARRLQDPLRQILKVDPSRLRLGSYQRELPQADLEVALRDAVSSAISKSGLDIFQSEPEALQRAPGMTLAAAKAVVAACHEEKITNRETLMAVLKEHLSETQARQAIGFLKVYGSDNTLDATTIHPDDYRLAARLVEHASLPLPPAAPEGWTKPNFKELAAVNAAAEEVFAKQQAEFGASLDAADDLPPEDAISEEVAVDTTAESVAEETVASEPTASAESTQENAGVPTESDPAAASATSESTEPSAESGSGTDSAATVVPTINPNMPKIETAPRERVPLPIDVERLARSWQVGREKLKRVANCLQFPFADDREFQYPVPLVCKLPRLDALQPGDMLQALVIGVTNFGVFVDLGPDCSGLIHISRLTTQYVEDPHQWVQVGDLLNVWVINIDDKRKRVALTAIPPGTPSRRDAERSNEERSNDGRGERRNDGRGRPEGANRGGAGRPAGARPAGARPEGAARSERPNDRGAGSSERGSGDRSGNNRGPQRGGKPGMGRGGNDRGRNDRGRGRNQEESAPRRASRVDPPKPVTPITDAMQQGKEPMRSFSDLMQFMKKSKTETEIVPENNNAAELPKNDTPVAKNDSHVSETSESNDSPNGPSA